MTTPSRPIMGSMDTGEIQPQGVEWLLVHNSKLTEQGLSYYRRNLKCIVCRSYAPKGEELAVKYYEAGSGFTATAIYNTFNQLASIQLAERGRAPITYGWLPMFGLCKEHSEESDAGHLIVLEDISLLNLLNPIPRQNIEGIKRNERGQIETVRIGQKKVKDAQ